jgi:NAD-dependent dihydropyrimidine dehydrogenase PreA subunit
MLMETRKIVNIDADKCNGCGLCVPSCAEGAIQMIDGKAVLLADNLCDGIGNCLGTCPQDAILIEERPADEFDEVAVERHLAKGDDSAQASAKKFSTGGCPGSAMKDLTPAPDTPCGCPGSATKDLSSNACACDAPTGSVRSELTQWPVQLTLLPPTGSLWNGADILLAADCSAFAAGDFHAKILVGKKLAIACPKLDDTDAYLTKLTAILSLNDVKSLTVVRMEVPCCGLDRLAAEARTQSGKDVPITIITLGLTGEVLSERTD